MKSSILIIIFDFFVCSLLLTVSFRSGATGSRSATPKGDHRATSLETASEFSETAVDERFNQLVAEYQRFEEEHIAQSVPPGVSREAADKLQAELDEAIGKSAVLETDLAQVVEVKKRAEAEAAEAARAAEKATQTAERLAEEKKKAEETAMVQAKAAAEEAKKVATLTDDKRKAEAAAAEATRMAEDAVRRAAILAEEKKKAEETAMVQAKAASEEAKKATEEFRKSLAESDASEKQAMNERDSLKKENEELKRMAQSSPTMSGSGGGKGVGEQEGSELSSPGGLDDLLASRVEVKVGITESDSIVRGGDDLFDQTFYPVVFELKDRAYLLTEAENFSLGWYGWSERAPEHVTRFSFTFSKRGLNPKSIQSRTYLLPLSVNPKLVIVPFPVDLIPVKPLGILGQGELGKGLIFDGIVYKTSDSGEPMIVKFQRDNSNKDQVIIVSEAVTPKGAKEAPKPELGDYLVTPSLKLAAIMIDENHGLIVTPEILERTNASIGLSEAENFIESEERWLEQRERWLEQQGE
jgi:chemotaxis protein histidine kinase CheA